MPITLKLLALHRGRTTVKPCIAAFKFKICSAGMPCLLLLKCHCTEVLMFSLFWLTFSRQCYIIKLLSCTTFLTRGEIMSLGYGGSCKRELEDENMIIYSYSSYNLNEEQFRNSDRIYDGTITINKSCLIEAEIHEKIKKMPNGRKKLIVKRIPKSIDIFEMIAQGQIQIENSKNTWKMLQSFDYIAISLCKIIFHEYQLNGILPEKCSYNV